MKKVQESKIIGYQTVHGQQVPVYQPEVHTEVKHKVTGKRICFKRRSSIRCR